MTSLKTEIVAAISVDGPMPVERYMSLCLSHPEHGYYMSRDPFGVKGDFTTAPEVSQMFGELIGIWCVSMWQTMEAPDPVHLIELGPGRGTLMADLIRAARVMPGFLDAARIHLVECSPVLRGMQEQALKSSTAKVSWHGDIEDVRDGPSLVIANEFFDALPVQQLQLADDGWHERVVGLDGDGKLRLGLARDAVPMAAVPQWLETCEPGDIIELAPARQSYAARVARRIANHSGALLFIDYGHTRSGAGDTLQAVQKHRYVDLLSRPGAADITSHVDFEALSACVESEELVSYGPMAQNRFLTGMGITERAEMLAKRGGARERMKVTEAVRRLMAGTEMGHLFKVLAATSKGLPPPQPFAQSPERRG